MGKLAQTNATDSEIAVISVRAAAEAAPVVAPHLEFGWELLLVNEAFFCHLCPAVPEGVCASGAPVPWPNCRFCPI